MIYIENLPYGISIRSRGNATNNIVLEGVAISSLLSALTTGHMILNSNHLGITYEWLVGCVSGKGRSCVLL